jgi:hypothetical protein
MEPQTIHDDEPVVIEEIERDDFLKHYWNYEPGEQVTIIGPTKRGKSTLGYQLLDKSANKDVTAHVLSSKPREYEETRKLQRSLGFKKYEDFPPPTRLPFQKKPRGYILKPNQTLTDLDWDNENLRKNFHACIMDCYASKDARIVFVDEAHEAQNELKLKKEIEAMCMRGNSLKCGGWYLAQRSAHNSYHIYSAPEHLFLFNDPDKRNRIRFGEIGGVEPRIVEDITNNLGQYQVLYIKRTGQHMCVVNP